MVQIRHDNQANFKFVWDTNRPDVEVGLGLSIRDEKGRVYDFPLQVGSKNTLQVPMWWINPSVDLNGAGVYDLIVSVWKETVEPLKTRLANTGWIENAFTAIEV